VREAIALQEDEYVRLKDTSSGQRWVQKGKALIFLEPTWTRTKLHNVGRHSFCVPPLVLHHGTHA